MGLIMVKKEELRKKDIQKISSSLTLIYPKDFTDFIADTKLFKTEIKIKERTLILYHTNDNICYLFEENGQIIPSLYSLRKFPDLLPKITVDAGAVKFMINGADLFRPGMVEWEEFKNNDYVTIINLHKAAMCIGRTILSSKDLSDKGKVTKTIHYLNDEIWNFKGS